MPKGSALSQLMKGVASGVAQAYRSGVWTRVEVSRIDTRGGHVYLELAERDVQGAAVAQVRAMIWASTATTILPRFEQATGVVLAAGIKLLVRVKPRGHAVYGLSLEINAIDPEYTLGDLEARKREIRERLQREGVFDANRRLAAPWDFNAVLVVAPESAAGLAGRLPRRGAAAAALLCVPLRLCPQPLPESRCSGTDPCRAAARARRLAAGRLAGRGRDHPWRRRGQLAWPGLTTTRWCAASAISRCPCSLALATSVTAPCSTAKRHSSNSWTCWPRGDTRCTLLAPARKRRRRHRCGRPGRRGSYRYRVPGRHRGRPDAEEGIRISGEIFRENYGILQRHAQTLRERRQTQHRRPAGYRHGVGAGLQGLPGAHQGGGEGARRLGGGHGFLTARPTHAAPRRPAPGAGVDDMDDDVPF